MISFTATTGGLERLAARVTNRANFLGSARMRSVVQLAGDDLVRVYRQHIDTFNPGDVPDLAESTKKQKAKQVGFVYPILKRTFDFYNRMRAIITAPSGGSGWRIQIDFPGTKGSITNNRLAEIFIRGEGRQPRRDFTQIPNAWKNRLFARLRNAFATL